MPEIKDIKESIVEIAAMPPTTYKMGRLS